ncbi:hypothetical protein H6792_00725 [Candidatus Nomurabacteria bacterium]|nr:hypothetical protein [Candidatus Nomurabacteria bacterium]
MFGYQFGETAIKAVGATCGKAEVSSFFDQFCKGSSAEGLDLVYEIVNNVANILVVIAVGVAVPIIMFSGIQIMLGGVGPEQIKQGKQRITRIVTALFGVIGFNVILDLLSQDGPIFKGTNFTEGNLVSIAQQIIANLVVLLTAIIGIVSVYMFITAGIKMLTSSGNPKAIESAKNTILYAIIGMAVALFAGVIVRAIIENIGGVKVG